MIQVSEKPKTGPLTARGQRTRQKLLDAAEQVFGELGYEAASVALITQRAGVGQGTYYLYFPDKQSAFVELVDELSIRLRRHQAEAVRGLETRLEIERAGLRAFFEFTREHRSLYRIIRQAEFVDLKCFRRYYDSMARAYVKGLARAKAELPSIDLEVLAFCLMGISDFLGMRFVLWADNSVDLDEITEHAMRFIGSGLSKPAAAKSSKGTRK